MREELGHTKKKIGLGKVHESKITATHVDPVNRFSMGCREDEGGQRTYAIIPKTNAAVQVRKRT